MNNIYIFQNRKALDKEKEKLNRAYLELKEQERVLMQNCSHDIVFKMNDNAPRRIFIDGIYYCPTCGLIEQFIHKEEFEKSNLKNSRVIPLTSLSLVSNPETLNKIREEVWTKLDLYYDSNIPVEELSKSMMNQLMEYQVDYLQKYKEYIKKR